MELDAQRLRSRAVRVARHPRTRKIAVWTVAIVAGIGILLGLITPPLIRGKLARELSAKLHREVSIEQLRINPYAMTVAIRGFVIKERQSESPAVSFDELFANLEFQSLFRLAPVLKELRLTRPYIKLVRNEDRKYNFQDLIDEFTARPSEPGPTPGFSLNNIQITDGQIEFDDRPENTKHEISALKIGIPFISSLPAHTDIKVRPEFYAVINGAPLHIVGDTKPFKDTHESVVSFNIDKLEIAKYLEYSPVALNFTMPSGQLGGKLTATFRTSTNQSPVLSITGDLGLKQLEMRQAGGAPLLKMRLSKF